MKKYQIKHLSDIPLEGTHNLPKSRKTLATKDDLVTNNIDAMTKGFLEPGEYWDWHSHDEHDEIGIVLSGVGNFYWEEEVSKYKPEDVIIIPAGSKHKFEATGDIRNEFYFVRIKI